MATALYMDCGTVDYGECWELQRGLFDRMVERAVARRDARGTVAGGEEIPDAGYVLLCQHPHVYTLGKSGKESNMLVSEDFLRSIGACFYHIDRGGDITYHGPGQIVGYPILDLSRIGMGLKDYVHSVEQAVIDTMADLGISCTRVQGAAGVWIDDARGLRKICAIGVRSSHYVTMHGFALNVSTDLRYFSHINPCGFADRGVTSVLRETGSADMERVKSLLLAHFAEIMNIEIIKTNDYADRKTMGY